MEVEKLSVFHINWNVIFRFMHVIYSIAHIIFGMHSILKGYRLKNTSRYAKSRMGWILPPCFGMRKYLGKKSGEVFMYTLYCLFSLSVDSVLSNHLSDVIVHGWNDFVLRVNKSCFVRLGSACPGLNPPLVFLL